MVEQPREQSDEELKSASGQEDRQAGGGPNASDNSAPGGSSGSGGYGEAQNQQFHQGQQRDRGTSGDDTLSRAERFDEAQGGGRSAEQVGGEEAEFATDQAEHQDRGQSEAAEETGRR